MELTYNKLNNDQKKVEHILERYPETRNSDIELFARFCESFYPPFERPLYTWRDLAAAMHSVTNFDHISRVRRKAIADSGYKKWLPTDVNIALRRGIAQDVWKEYALSNNLPLQHYASNIPEGFDDEGNIQSAAR